MSASERKIAELEAENRRLQHLLSKQLTGNYAMTMESGVNDKGQPFVTSRWGDEVGQLTPDEVRQHAIKLVECASAAEFDAALVRALTEPSDSDLPVMTHEQAVVFLGLIREHRGGTDQGSMTATVGDDRG